MFYPIAKQLLYEHYRSDLEAPINEYIRSMTIEPALSSYIKHISISFGVTDFTGDMRPETEIRKDLQALGATKEHYLYFEDLAQLELAIIVLHAHNLESLQMQAQVHDRELDIDDFPIWLRPFIDAVQHGPKLPLENPRYENLHTLDINMQSTFEPDLSYLFLLPKLRKLRLGSVQFESDSMSENTPPVPWPIATAVSGVQELRLTDVDLPAYLVGQIIKSCKAITLFECLLDNHRRPNIRKDSFWCQEIVTALYPHTSSLESLSLQTRGLQRLRKFQWPRVHGLPNFRALKRLTTQFYILVGVPGCTRQQRSHEQILQTRGHLDCTL